MRIKSKKNDVHCAQKYMTLQVVEKDSEKKKNDI